MFTTRSVRLKELLAQKLTERVWKFGSFPGEIRVIRDQLYLSVRVFLRSPDLHVSDEPRLNEHHHPEVELRANLKKISHRCHLFEVAFAWELTKETIHLPLGCLQGG